MPEFAAPQQPTHKPHDRHRVTQVQPPSVAPGPGRPLDGDVRSGMEARFGHDFSQVRVHSDEKSAATTRAYGALAYTTGSDIFFNSGRYRPDTATGRRLLAHELAHVVQQAGAPSAVQTKDMSTPGDAAERTADAAAHIFGQRAQPDRSLALDLRDALRATRTPRPMAQRAVPTWAGEFDTDKYGTVLDAAKKNQVGVEIDVRFKPGKHVDAELIGMVQKATSKDKGKPVFPGASPTITARSIPAGKAGEGANIDQLQQFRNPLYATGAAKAKDQLGDTPTQEAWGQHGWRYTDKAGEHKQDALLKDKTRIEPHGPNSSQIFETTAVAIKGVQEGTYYGSVQWGWQTNTPGVQLVNSPAKAGPGAIIGKLPKNTRLEVTDKGAAAPFNKGAKAQWWRVTVVDGAFIGRVGWVMESLLSDTVTK